jgi:hypothetical protein
LEQNNIKNAATIVGATTGQRTIGVMTWDIITIGK